MDMPRGYSPVTTAPRIPPCRRRQRRKATAAMMATQATAPAAMPAAAPAERPLLLLPSVVLSLDDGVGVEGAVDSEVVEVVVAGLVSVEDWVVLRVVVALSSSSSLLFLSLLVFGLAEEDKEEEERGRALLVRLFWTTVRVMVCRTMSKSSSSCSWRSARVAAASVLSLGMRAGLVKGG